MANEQVAIRLTTQGGDTVLRALEQIGQVAQAQFRKAGEEARQFSRAASELHGSLSPDRLVAGMSAAGAPSWRDMAARMGARSGSPEADARMGGLQRHEWINLTRQFQDVATMGAMGMSPMSILTSQGAQVYDALANSSVGAKAALADLKATALGAITPMRVLGATVVTAAGVSVAAVARWKGANDELAASLEGLGRSSGLTLAGANEIAARAAAGTPGLSIRSAQSLTAGYLGAGIDRGVVGGVASSTMELSRKLGLSFDDAAKELTAAFADPARGAEELAKKYGVVSLAQAHHVDALTKVGDRSGAAAELLKDLRAGLDRIADRRSPFMRLVERVETGVSDAFTNYGEALANNPANATVNRLFGIQGHETARGVFDRMRSGEMERRYAERQADLAGQDALSVTRAVAPDLFARRDLEQQLAKLDRALGREGVGKVLEGLGVSGDMTREAVERLKISLELLRAPAERVAEENALRRRSLEAETTGQRAQITAEEAYRAELRSSHDRLAAVTAAEGARNLTLLEASRALRDERKDAERRADLAGLTPYERMLKETEHQYREDLKRADASPGARADMSIYDRSVILPLDHVGNAATHLADTLTSAASRIGRLVSIPEQRAATTATTPFFASGGDLHSRIMRAEGTARFGDPYNVSLGYRASPKPLVEMTMRESLDWGETIARQEMARTGLSRGAVSSAKGAYQIVNATQRDAMRSLGIDENETFSAANQDRMADWIFRRQGLRAWEGFKSHPAEAAGAQAFGDQATQISGADDALKKMNATRREWVTTNVEQLLRDESRSLDEQRRAIDLSSNALGLNKEQMAAAEEQQKLLSEAQRRGIPITEELTRRTGELAQKAAENARAQEATRRRTAELDFARDATTNVASSAAIAAVHGENVGDALRSSLRQVEDELIRRSIGDVVGMFLGDRGSANAGLFGDLFGLNKTSSARDMTVTANSVTIGGQGLGGAGGGWLSGLGGSGGGLLGSFFGSSGLGGLFVDHNANFAGQAAGAIGPFPQSGAGAGGGDLVSGLGSILTKGLGSVLGGSGGSGGLGTIDIRANTVNVSGGAGGLLGGLGGGSGGSGGFLSSLSGLFGGGSGGGDFLSGLFSAIGSIGGLFGFAEGGVMTSAGALPLHRYASGGIADRPQLALFGEGRDREAYIPLRDPRGIHVRLDPPSRPGEAPRAHVALPDGRGIPAFVTGMAMRHDARRDGRAIDGFDLAASLRGSRVSAFAEGGVMTSAGPASLPYPGFATLPGGPRDWPALRLPGAAASAAAAIGARAEQRPIRVEVVDGRGGNKVEVAYATPDQVRLMISANNAQLAERQQNSHLSSW